MTKETLIIPH